jgi:glyoxylase-like metal-dependent hydrolase (beta-lactamase superfamily II)
MCVELFRPLNILLMLEDNHEDIIAKAMRGKSVGKSMLADAIGVGKTDIEKLLSGEVLEDVIARIGPHLNLDSEKLLISASKEWSPKPIVLPGVKRFESDFGEMSVNSYVVFDQDSKKALVFDTGTNCSSLISFIEEDGLKVDSILLTHTHRDHIYCLEQLKSHFSGIDIFVHESEQLVGTIPIEKDFKLRIGAVQLNTLHTHGHSAGGLTYLMDGLPYPVAIVGDALFAGSMGGGMASYADALKTNREKLMTLTDETIICPGHGPMSTIGEEKKYNPFFPEF